MVFAEEGKVLVSGSVMVEVVCHHAGAGGGEPLVVLRCAVGRDLEPSLKDTLRGGGRVFVNGIRVDPDDGAMITGILRLARESGYVPAVKRELWCPCGLTVEVSETELREALTRLAERGVTQAELSGFNR